MTREVGIYMPLYCLAQISGKTLPIGVVIVSVVIVGLGCYVRLGEGFFFVRVYVDLPTLQRHIKFIIPHFQQVKKKREQ